MHGPWQHLIGPTEPRKEPDGSPNRRQVNPSGGRERPSARAHKSDAIPAGRALLCEAPQIKRPHNGKPQAGASRRG